MQQTEDQRFNGPVKKVVITHTNEEKESSILEQLTYSKTGQLLENINTYSETESTKTTCKYDTDDRKNFEEIRLIKTQIVIQSLNIEYKENQTKTEVFYYNYDGNLKSKRIKTEENLRCVEQFFDHNLVLTETITSVYDEKKCLLKETKISGKNVLTSLIENNYTSEHLLKESKTFFINYEEKEINRVEKMSYNSRSELIEKVDFENGIITSIYRAVFQNEILREKIYLDENSNPYSKIIYNEEGNEISTLFWNNEGELESETHYLYHENGEYKERNVKNKNGLVTFSILCDEQGRNVSETTFDENSGEIIRQKNFVFKEEGNQKEVWEYTKNKELRYHKINTMDENDNVIRYIEQDIFYNSTIDQHYNVNGLLLRESIINGMDKSIHCTEIEYDEFLNETCTTCTQNGSIESITKTEFTHFDSY